MYQFTNIGNDLFTFSHIESSGTGSAMRCHSSLKALTSQLDRPIIITTIILVYFVHDLKRGGGMLTLINHPMRIMKVNAMV